MRVTGLVDFADALLASLAYARLSR